MNVDEQAKPPDQLPGDAAPQPLVVAEPLPTQAHAEDLRRQVCSRIRRDGIDRWHEAAKVRDELALAAAGLGLKGPAKLLWMYQELATRFPPLDSPEPPPEPPSQPIAAQVRGLGLIPESWGTLPANASLQAEIGWVQANRLLVVQDQPAGGTIVHLDRALSPAPSHAALGWLETSIRSYAKYIDVVARAMSSTITEHELVQREKHSIEEIHEVLRQMLDE